MKDTYVECLIKAKSPSRFRIFSMILIVLTIVFGCLMFVFMPFLLLAVATGVGAYFVNLYCHMEYEYCYLDREITVDRILSQTKRKRVAAYQVDRIEILAPIHSWHLDNYQNRDVKVTDYSIGEELQPDLRYAMYYEGGIKVLLSPSDELVKAVKDVAPRKVFTD